jgi:hypothetical protein
MNRALAFLFFSLLKRRALEFFFSLRRPGKLAGVAALAVFLGFLFHFRGERFFGELVRTEVVVGLGLIMLGGALFKGFLHRGLVFDPPDIEFLFTGPFAQSQVILYRLLPNYLYAIAQSIVFGLLFATHLTHPAIAAIGLALFQIACFHISAAASIYGGSIADDAHYRIRWFLTATCLVLTLLYFRMAWGLVFIPKFLLSPLAQFLFSPSGNLNDLASSGLTRQWAAALAANPSFFAFELWRPFFCLFIGVLMALFSLVHLLKLKVSLFESSLAASSNAAEARQKIDEGRRVIAAPAPQSASWLPQSPIFTGVGAIIWKNLIAARRARRELAIGAGFTAVYTFLLIALRWQMHRLMSDGADLGEKAIEEFDMVIFAMMVALPFFLQRTFPFDFRRDGLHLLNFRALPVSALGIVLAELAVPIFCCLALQAIGILALLFLCNFNWLMLLQAALALPAVVIAINCVWNLHYLLVAAKRAGGRAGATSAVGVLMVVAISFLAFFPAGWVGTTIGRSLNGHVGDVVGVAAGLVTQYGVNVLLILALVALFKRYEISHEG